MTVTKVRQDSGHGHGGHERPIARLLLLTALIAVAYFCFSLMDNMNGPTAVDLSRVTHSSVAAINYGMLVKAVSYCYGAVFFGYLFKHVNRCRGFITTMMSGAAATAAVAFASNAHQFWATQALMGFTSAGSESVFQPWLLRLWGDRAAVVMISVHVFYATGNLFVPLIARPFLSSSVIGDGTATTEANIAAPYLIAAASAAVAALLLLLFHLTLDRDGLSTSQWKSSTSADRTASKTDDAAAAAAAAAADRKRFYEKTVVVIACLICSCKAAANVMANTLTSEFLSLSEARLNQQDAAVVLSFQTMMYIGANIASIPLAAKVNPVFLYFFDITFFSTGTMMQLWTEQRRSLTILACSLTGTGMSNTYPALFAMVGQRMEVSTKTSGYIMFAGRFVVILVILLLGPLIEQHPYLFVYVNLSLVTAALLFTLCLLLADRILLPHLQS